jgi:hypothetical protein
MWIRAIIIGLAVAATMVGAAFARDYTFSNGMLSDDQFYQAVSCKAKLDGRCQEKPARWPAYLSNQLTVGLAQVQSGTTDAQEAVVRDALIESVALINASGANIKLRYVSGIMAHRTWIKFHIVQPLGPRHLIAGVSLKGINGLTAQNARTKLYVTQNHKIGRAGVTISNTITDPIQLRALVLEELVQSLGLMWDIENPFYNTISIFSQSGPDNLLQIEGQDKAALQRHYPF